MLEKRGEFFIFKKIFLVIILLEITLQFSSALSITPALVYMDFQSDSKQTLEYTVYGTKQDTNYLVYIKGDLAEYASLNKEELNGDGSFKVLLSLPFSLEVPGLHVLYVGVKELADKEVVGGNIGTSIELIASVSVFVPYPGKYLEISSSSESVNMGEPVYFKIDLTNRGEENLTIFPRIEIFLNQSKEIKETLLFEERTMESTQKLSLYKLLNTSLYDSGRYRGVAIVEYGGESPAIAESSFRIGNLFIEVKNYTNKIILDGKIQKFSIDIESGWNDKIDGVYANVIFSNETSEVLSFETSSTELNPWEVKTITGYFDTLNFEEGMYNANITLFYYGRDVGKSSTQMVQVEFIKKSFPILMIVLISAGAIVLIALITWGIFFLIRRKSNNKSREK